MYEENQGWIKLHRKLMEKAIWLESTPEQKTILIVLLMMANHKGREWEWKGQRFKAAPGQFVTSLKSIAKNCGDGVSTQNVRTAIKRFEKYDFLTSKSTNKNRLITIENWGIYQAKDNEPNKQSNKHLTSTQQAPNKHLTTNKNVRMQEYNYIYNSEKKNVDNFSKDKPSFLEWAKKNKLKTNETFQEHMKRWKKETGFYEKKENLE